MKTSILVHGGFYRRRAQVIVILLSLLNLLAEKELILYQTHQEPLLNQICLNISMGFERVIKRILLIRNDNFKLTKNVGVTNIKYHSLLQHFLYPFLQTGGASQVCQLVSIVILIIKQHENYACFACPVKEFKYRARILHWQHKITATIAPTAA